MILSPLENEFEQMESKSLLGIVSSDSEQSHHKKPKKPEKVKKAKQRQTDESGLMLSDNQTGYLGVYPAGKKFAVLLSIGSVGYSFGTYEDAKAAATVATELYNLEPAELQKRAQEKALLKRAQDATEDSVRQVAPAALQFKAKHYNACHIRHIQVFLIFRWHSRCQSTACLIQRTP